MPRKRPLLYVAEARALRECARALLEASTLAVDTEANSMFAYRERLCLLQFSTADADFLVDPIALADLSPLVPVFEDPGIEKVFHDGEYDVIQIRAALRCRVVHVYDTKIAAVALGVTSYGLAALLKEHFGIELDKRLQRSDWGDRPLSPEQLEYARTDTAHLLALAEVLERKIDEAGGVLPDEVRSECLRLEALSCPEERQFEPEGFARLAGASRLDPDGRQALRQLFIMRDELAAARNQPHFKILPNAVLLELAKARPEDSRALAGVAAVPRTLARRFEREILQAIVTAAELGPLLRLPPARDPDGLGDFDDRQRALYERLRSWRKTRASLRPTDPSHILNRASMKRIVQEHPKSLEELERLGILEPWRIREYGQELIAVFSDGSPRKKRRRRKDVG